MKDFFRTPLSLTAGLVLQYSMMKLTSLSLYPFFFFYTAENYKIPTENLFKNYMLPENQNKIDAFKTQLTKICQKNSEKQKFSVLNRFEEMRSMIPKKKKYYNSIQLYKDHYWWFYFSKNFKDLSKSMSQKFFVGESIREVISLEKGNLKSFDMKLKRGIVFSDEIDFMILAGFVGLITLPRSGISGLRMWMRNSFRWS